MKRELKAGVVPTTLHIGNNRKGHPDEKGTESPSCLPRHPIPASSRIARAIPMKRELKADMVLVRVRGHDQIAMLIPMKMELKFAGATLRRHLIVI